MTKRIGVLLSGRGSNFEALADSVSAGRIPGAQISIVISNREGAPGLQRAEDRGIATRVIPSKWALSAKHMTACSGMAALDDARVDLVCLAGFMRLLSPYRFSPAAFRGRILEHLIHRSLPSFPGLEAQRQALEYGVKFSGCSVHFRGRKSGCWPDRRAGYCRRGTRRHTRHVKARASPGGRASWPIYTEAVKLVLIWPIPASKGGALATGSRHNDPSSEGRRARMSTHTTFAPADEQLAALRKGSAEIIREDELRAKIERSRASGKPLRVKLGVDPTAPDLHLGHTVVLRKLKHFQDQGHTAIFLIGGFTALVGDPTGQSKTRPPLSREQVEANAKTYLEQVYKLLDPQKTEIRNNLDWLGSLSSQEMVRLCAKYRVARLLEHEDFRSRLAKQEALSLHELLYPLLQAYDSVALQADVELGATEQKFNLLDGQGASTGIRAGIADRAHNADPRRAGGRPQDVQASLDNYVGINGNLLSQMFGKLMSISGMT